MSLLIRGGTLLTMDESGSFQGDLKTRGSAIAEVTAHPLRIEPESDDVVLEAGGLYVMPGMVDPFVSASAEDDTYVAGKAMAAGITSALIWDDSDHCTLFCRGKRQSSSFLRINPARCTDRQLDDHLLEATERNLTPVIDIQTEAMGIRTLLSIRRTGAKPILFRLSGCVSLTEAIAETGCPVVPAPYGMCGSSPWQMAARLAEHGAQTALTCAYPYTMMKHLPLCAALCHREGMQRSEALRAITSTPASLLGLSTAGRLSPGFDADICIYDGDPLLIASSLVMTIIGGKIYREDMTR